MMDLHLLTSGRATAQPPGRTPHRSALRCPGGETPLPGDNPRAPMPPEASAAPAREARI